MLGMRISTFYLVLTIILLFVPPLTNGDVITFAVASFWRIVIVKTSDDMKKIR